MITHAHTCIFMEVNNSKKSDSMDKIENQSDPKVLNLIQREFDVKTFRF